MKKEFVNYTREDGVAVVTIDRPPMNAFDAQTRAELADILDELSQRKNEVRVVILTGAGEKAFVSGADIRMLRDRTKEEAWADSKPTIQFFLKLEESETPVICAIKGYCLGA
ncbi:enoyl-CoA hydratase/isomerase family protein, partial [Chloroflexota bacterium]